jgi:hypothetical protein
LMALVLKKGPAKRGKKEPLKKTGRSGVGLKIRPTQRSPICP